MNIPHESYRRLFMRFLRFGLLAWGGPVPQIARIRQEFVDEERWISSQRFNRVLAVYQALPGPEATELCVYFGMLARGRLGGLLAGLAFMMPGFLLMLLFSWLYFSYSGTVTALKPVFWAMQPVVVALIVRAVHRIGEHAVHHSAWLLGIAVLVGITSFLYLDFWITLPIAGLLYILVQRQAYPFAIPVGVALMVLAIMLQPAQPSGIEQISIAHADASVPILLLSGLKAGLLTFGGAYTVIPFLQQDAVINGGWITNQQFLDGIALSGILPAPLVIVGTFVGYLAGGLWGALALTLGIFLPAFSFTLIGHTFLEKMVENSSLHNFLDGVTAGVVGVIAATTISLARTALISPLACVFFGIALIILYRWKSKAAVPVVVLAAGLLGYLISELGIQIVK
jgi:chromate transporter